MVSFFILAPPTQSSKEEPRAMKASASHLKTHLLHLQNHVHHIRIPSPPPKLPTPSTTAPRPSLSISLKHNISATNSETSIPKHQENNTGALPTDHRALPRWVLLGGASIGLALLILAVDGQQEALALGPEGPLVEEFWDNVRRYGLYILTVSTGAIYTIILPIYELLKNPITAILLLVLLGGAFFLVTQVLSAMVGISEFSYDYGY